MSAVIEVMGIDPRALSTERLSAPHPLPLVSRRALKRVKDRFAIPTTCNCCGGRVRLVSNSEIYAGREYGDWPYAYLCDGCRAYVGLHPGTDLPLGTLADATTRNARADIKPLFMVRIVRNRFEGDRNAAYAWLAERMGIDKRLCHWGIFTLEQCKQALHIIRNEE